MVHVLPRNFGAVVRDAVLREIDGDPVVHQCDVTVTAEDGLVTLTGCVNSRGAKVAVERAAKRVPGVRIVANDLHVKSRSGQRDTDIARDALHRLRNNRAIPLTVQAVVSEGCITLDGTVTYIHQRLAAECAVKYIRGVKGVANDIALETPCRPAMESPVEGRAPWHA
jgi:osmotically-inducible protein OsmY